MGLVLVLGALVSEQVHGVMALHELARDQTNPIDVIRRFKSNELPEQLLCGEGLPFSLPCGLSRVMS